jgi:hypothetical protein
MCMWVYERKSENWNSALNERGTVTVTVNVTVTEIE